MGCNSSKDEINEQTLNSYLIPDIKAIVIDYIPRCDVCRGIDLCVSTMLSLQNNLTHESANGPELSCTGMGRIINIFMQ